MKGKRTAALASAIWTTFLITCIVQCLLYIWPGTDIWGKAVAGSSALAAVALYIRYRAGLDGLCPTDLGCLRLTARDLALGAIVGIAEHPLEQPLVRYLCRGISPAEWGLIHARVALPTMSHPSTFVASFLGVFLAATAEEIFFRGYLVGRLSKTFGLASTLIISSSLFCVAHCLPIQLYPYYLIGGLIYGMLRLASGSLWPALVAHTICNLMSVWNTALK